MLILYFDYICPLYYFFLSLFPLPIFFPYLFFGGGTGDWTQGFTLAKQASTSWATPPVPFALVILEMGSQELFAQAGFKPWSSWSQPSQVARITAVSHWCPTFLIFKMCFIMTFLYVHTICLDPIPLPHHPVFSVSPIPLVPTPNAFMMALYFFYFLLNILPYCW
jgi:hypothetical protein